MIFQMMARSALSYGGGNTTFLLVGRYLTSGLGSYGSAIREICVTACFRGGKIRNPSLQESYDTFHQNFLPSLPKVKFLRKRGEIDIEYETRIADADFLER